MRIQYIIWLYIECIICKLNKQNPFFQNLPDCNADFEKISKKTESKALLCPMIRDEKGFLSEFTAYYQIHGIDHILFFDHNSVDQSQFIELKPWIDNGFVSIISSFSTQTLGGVTSPLPTSFDEIMRLKILTEVYCKQYGVNMGFEYFFSVDVDDVTGLLGLGFNNIIVEVLSTILRFIVIRELDSHQMGR